MTLRYEKPERSVERGIKLLKRIAKMRGISTTDMIGGKLLNLIPRPKGRAEYPDHMIYEDPAVVPVEKVRSCQRRVSAEVIILKAQGKWEHHDPEYPCMIFDENTDEYILQDGNHRVNLAKILRKPTIEARVGYPGKTGPKHYAYYKKMAREYVKSLKDSQVKLANLGKNDLELWQRTKRAVDIYEESAKKYAREFAKYFKVA